jgi:hypothetical protein
MWVSACTSRRRSRRAIATAGTARGHSSPTAWQQADQALAADHTASAAAQYLRAAEYYRQAFFWHRDDLERKELKTGYPALVRAFRAALPHLERPGTVLEGDTPGYFFAPAADGPFPTILHIGGYDGTAEETYPAVYPALDRGWAFAGLDGPGTGAVLYDRQQPMRPDWESVVPGMVDVVLGCPEVDPKRIVLVGRSFGGLLAPRGASGEPRLAAMIVDPGQYDIAGSLKRRLGDLWESLDDPTAEAQFDSLLENPAMKTLLGPRMATHGIDSPRAYLGDMRRYNCVERRRRSPARATSPTTRPTPFPRDRARSCSRHSRARRSSGASSRRRAPRAIARVWLRSCSGPRRSTGSSPRSRSGTEASRCRL